MIQKNHKLSLPKNHISVSYIRNFVFGVEDSLVSTVGLLSGVAIASVSREIIFLTGVILILVESVSMAAGSFLSEVSAEGYSRHKESSSQRAFISAGVMFFSYFISGFVPLAPYLLLSVSDAFPVSIILSLCALFLLGAVSGKLSATRVIHSGVRMALVGGVAIMVGVAAGKFIGAVLQ